MKTHSDKRDITGNLLIAGREYLVYDTDDVDGVDINLDKWTLLHNKDGWFLDNECFDIDTLVESVVFIPVAAD